MTGTEATTAVVTSQVPEQPDPAGGDAATNPIITTAIDGSGTAAEVDLRQPAVLPDGQASALQQAMFIILVFRNACHTNMTSASVPASRVQMRVDGCNMTLSGRACNRAIDASRH